MTISQYRTRKAEKDQRFMRFLKELRLQRLYFKCIKDYPNNIDAEKIKTRNQRGNLILHAFDFRLSTELLRQYYPNLSWEYIDDVWYSNGVRIKKTKNILSVTKHPQKYMT